MKKISFLLLFLSTLSFSIELNKVNIEKLETECIQNKNGESCYTVGKLKVSKQNILGAYTYLLKGCNLNNYPSCSLMGTLLLRSKVKGQQIKAIPFLVKACKNGNEKEACTLLETMKSSTKDSLQKKCDNNDVEACLNVTRIYFKEGETGLKNAFESLDKACDLGSKKGCETKKVLIRQISKNISGLKGKDEYLKELGIDKYFE